ncbi:MAG: DUF1320 domain-containing protein [Bacteroidetes bacterium HGW-Bacteroidetes-4]|jgi:phage gp36-like protein|nr:MAG: DUF1320 domain-containing protein [Bacteroidetes bacterium HGW-Bacteroidetes-4]
MAFIEETDLARAMRQEYIDEIKRTDDALIPHCTGSAIAEMKTYLRETYDVDTIFAKTAAQRNSLLVTFAVDIAIYNLIEAVPVGVDVEQRRLRYKRAIDWLIGVQKQNIMPDLPILADSPAQSAIIIKSVERRELRY